MSASIIGMNGELDKDEQGSENPLDSALAKPAQQPSQSATTVSGEQVPDKYQGKNAGELLDIVTHQESLMGRQSTELGTLRSQVGTLRTQVDSALALGNSGDGGQGGQRQPDPITDRDFALDPVDATRRMIQEETVTLKTGQTDLKSQARALQFDQARPSAQADINDEQFINFVKSSATRMRLANSAFGDMGNPDFDSADQLWDLYDDFKAIKAAEPTAAAKDGGASDGASKDPTPTQDASQASADRTPPSMVSGTSGGTGEGGGEHAGKPIYSQAALNTMQEEDPTKFWSDAVQKPLAIARSEGRVRQDV